jgi:hypothetical protein
MGLLIAALLLPTAAAARELFTSAISVQGLGVRASGTHDIREVPNLYGNAELSQLFPGYQGTEEVNVVIDLRGVPAFMRFEQNSNALEIRIPSVGVSVRFPGLINRDVTLELLRAWLRGDIRLPGQGNSSGSVTPLLRAFIRESSVDPIAGNPNSLQSKMVNGDFELANSGPFATAEQLEGGGAPLENRWRVAGAFSYLQAGPHAGESYDLDFGYERNLAHPRFAFLLDIPIAVTRAERGLSYMGSVAAGLQYRIRPWWNITNVLRLGFGGSFDLAGLAVLYQGSSVSSMHWQWDEWSLQLGNMIGLGSNISSVEYGNLPVDYDLFHVVLENGLEIGRSLPLRLRGAPMALRAYYQLTNYLGTELYLEDQHQVGLRFGNQALPERFAFDVGYVGGSGYDSIRLRMTGRF